MRLRALIGCCSLSAALWTGCSTDRAQQSTPLTALWKPQLLYLKADVHRALYVEVDAVEGTQPDDAVLDELKGALETYCDKPDGIQIVRNDTIPRSKAVGHSPVALASLWLNGPPTNSASTQPAFIYVLYYDSRLQADPTMARLRPVPKHEEILRPDYRFVASQKPHVRPFPYPAAIYVDRRSLQAVSSRLEPLVLKHEAGHLLGLAANESHSQDNHCLSDGCLMRAKITVSLRRSWKGLFPTLQTNFCDQCISDLQEARKAPATNNLRFAGPTLLRTENAYRVAALPNGARVSPNADAKLNWQEFHHDSQAWAGSKEGRSGNWRAWVYASDNYEPVLALKSFESATNDVFAFVRESTRRTLPQAYARVGMLTIRRQPQEAVALLRQGAESGNADAENGLGLCYTQGIGVQTNGQEAVRWYRRAIAKNHRDAQHNLAGCFEDGFGVPKDPAQAIKLYQAAAAAGNGRSMARLGYIHFFGQGVPTNRAEGLKWLRQAGKQGVVQVQNRLGSMYYQGLGLETNYTEAAYWYRKAAEQGNPGGHLWLGYLYQSGHGVPQSDLEAYQHYLEAAEKGEKEGQKRVAALLATGTGVARDLVGAYVWFTMAIDQDSQTSRKARDQLAANMSPELISEAEKRADELRKRLKAPPGS